MQKVVIIEDEAMAAEHLKRSLKQVIPDATVIAVLQSIEESIEYFDIHPMPDLCFMDIHLADGLSMRIFDKVHFECPIIFTTAYDQYALEAFRAGGVDYLLKPINPSDLQRAIDKINAIRGNHQQPESNISSDALSTIIKQLKGKQQYKSSFFVTVRDRLIPVEVREVACFYLEDKITRALYYDKHTFIVDFPLDSLMDQLDPTLFFRANRQYIVARKAIQEITLWPIGKLALSLNVPTPDRIIISKARVSDFKQWYTY